MKYSNKNRSKLIHRPNKFSIKKKIQSGGGSDWDVKDNLLTQVLDNSTITKLLNGEKLTTIILDTADDDISNPDKNIKLYNICFNYYYNYKYNISIIEHILDEYNNKKQIFETLLNIIYEIILYKIKRIEHYSLNNIPTYFCAIRHLIAILFEGISDLIFLLMEIYRIYIKDNNYNNINSINNNFFLKKQLRKEKQPFLNSIFDLYKELHFLLTTERNFYYLYFDKDIIHSNITNNITNNRTPSIYNTCISNKNKKIYFKTDHEIIHKTREAINLLEFIFKKLHKNYIINLKHNNYHLDSIHINS